MDPDRAVIEGGEASRMGEPPVRAASRVCECTDIKSIAVARIGSGHGGLSRKEVRAIVEATGRAG